MKNDGNSPVKGAVILSDESNEIFHIAFPNGDSYKGGWVNRRQHGKGVMTYCKSANEKKNRLMESLPESAHFFKYEGDWCHGKRHGHGLLQSFIFGEIEWKYFGAFYNDRIEGKGVMVCADNRKITGVWYRGQLSGPGTIDYTDGRRYFGNFENGLRHGRGVMIFPDGRKYDGNWLNDQRSGHGLLTWADGSYYEGKFAYGLRHGYGVMVWLNGRDYRSYVGVLSRQIPNLSSDSRCRRYEGNWHRDAKQGFGKEIDAQGNVTEGVYIADSLIGPYIETDPPNQ
mmetsp:Transcript_1801/g.2559  ORF Transcript_1801/g.2559 Transcript_1801/m.2559 type:complete len:284 (-) Transcript_1801:8-859(-)